MQDQEATVQGTEIKLTRVEILAIERNKLALERTLMAWIRTALSMISFGFAIYKFMQVMRAENTVLMLRPQAPRNLGLTLTGMGIFALVVASIQHVRSMKALVPQQRYRAWDLALIVAVLLGLLGLLLFGSILLGSGPFG